MGGNVEEIKGRLDIAEVLGGYLKLEKAGTNFKAKCPFHSEKTASFFVSTQRQSYYCFGCGAKGDIFTFVQEMEGVNFKEALATLAERAGVTLKYERGASRETKGEKEKILEVLEVAASYYESELKKDANALKYFKSRGVTEESIKNFRLGLAPKGWRNLREHLRKLGYADPLLTKAGLIKKSAEHEDKEPYDVFRNRIIFPLTERGEVIAFSGRALDKEEEPKYLNSPDTPVFTKSSVLYGLDKALDDIRKKKYSVLVEGQLDLVLSHQAGVKNTVASSGTAFTEAHLKRLKLLSPQIVLAFDGDEAGRKAAERSAALAFGQNLRVNIAELPEGKDPADVASADKEKWKEILKSSTPAIKFFLDVILEDKNLDVRKKQRLTELKLVPLIASMVNKLEQEHAVSLISQRLSWSHQSIWESVRKAKPVATSAKEEAVAEPEELAPISRLDRIKEALETIKELLKSFAKKSPEHELAQKNKEELEANLRLANLEMERDELRLKLGANPSDKLLKEFVELSKRLDEERRRVL